MIKENLGAFKEHKFFTLLEQFGNEQKEQEKERQKGKDKDKAKPKQKNDQQKEAAQAAKDSMDVVKKAIDNFNRFKGFAGSQIEEYKKFWSMQKSVCGRFTKSGMCYALFNDGSSDKYKPLYVVSIEAVEGKPCLCVFKTTLEEGDENPIFAIRNPQAEKEFKGFLNDMKRSLKEVKDKYVQTVEAKKKEEENKKKRERLDKFLKESADDDPEYIIRQLRMFSEEIDNIRDREPMGPDDEDYEDDIEAEVNNVKYQLEYWFKGINRKNPYYDTAKKFYDEIMSESSVKI